MTSNEFDRRYPAMFQPGGEHIAAEKQIAVPVDPAPIAVTAAVPAAAPVPAIAEMPEAETAAMDLAAEASPASAPTLARWLRWSVPAALGLTMLVLGSLVLFIPQWMTQNGYSDPYSYGSSSAEQLMFLMYTVAPAASPLAAGGLGIFAILFFLFTRYSPAHEPLLRGLFAIASIVLVVLVVLC